MKSDFLASYGLVFLNCIALLLFVAVFVGALWWIFKPSNKKLFDYLKKLPFDDK